MYKQILNKKSLSAHSKNKFQTFIFLILEKYDIYFIYLSFFAKNSESTPPHIPPKKKSIFWYGSWLAKDKNPKPKSIWI